MPEWRFGDRVVSQVGLIDDEPNSQEALGWLLGDAELTPIPIVGPLPSIDELMSWLSTAADAFICDHHLQVSNYATFNGAEVVARSAQAGYLAILCTRFTNIDIEGIRPYLPHIPVLRRPDELQEPDQLFEALAECAAELSGIVPPERKGWRAQVVVERIDSQDQVVDVSVPAWEIEETVRLRFSDLPGNLIAKLAIGYRFRASVNLGAESADRLFLHEWST